MDQSRITGNSMVKPEEPSASRTSSGNSQVEGAQTTGESAQSTTNLAAPALDDDSAITILLHLEEERGKMFREAEYRKRGKPFFMNWRTGHVSVLLPSSLSESLV